ncbi:hypothetical protein QYE76_052074 [Lolium multiflorum]|uniref:Uncharacterized protein n=1 Tax=Lolium multiflorum TaxID=4521 RepID=A0AAD8SUL0_LOLMU|nr:hypothetical protein QYE76_052074 [Lolium multiflorum]
MMATRRRIASISVFSNKDMPVAGLAISRGLLRGADKARKVPGWIGWTRIVPCVCSSSAELQLRNAVMQTPVSRMHESSTVDGELQYLRVAMGHENESFEDFVKSHDACQEDLMFFPKNKSYGLASVAGNADKISALQHEFEIVRKRMDAEAKKAYK